MKSISSSSVEAIRIVSSRKPFQGLRKFRSTTMQRFRARKKLVGDRTFSRFEEYHGAATGFTELIDSIGELACDRLLAGHRLSCAFCFCSTDHRRLLRANWKSGLRLTASRAAAIASSHCPNDSYPAAILLNASAYPGCSASASRAAAIAC